MIKQKESELGGRQKNSVSQKVSGNSKESLITKLKEKTYDSTVPIEQIDEYQKIINIFENMEWGEGEELSQFSDLVQSNLKFPIETSKVNKSISNLIKNGDLSFLIEKSNPLENFVHLVSSFCFITEVTQKSPNFLKNWSELMQLEEGVFIDSLHSCILKNEGYDPAKIYDYIIKGKSPLTTIDEQKRVSIFTGYSFMKGSNHPKQVETILHELKSEFPVIQCLRPLPKMKDKKDFKTALKIFNQEQGRIDLKKVKKTYRNLLSKAHPDRISNLGLKDEYVKIAHSNFISIQNAYDLLKSKGK